MPTHLAGFLGRAAWLRAGQDWAGVPGADMAWGGSWLARVSGDTVGCCHAMAGTRLKLLGGWCRRGQEQALGAGMWEVECPPCTRVLFTCVPAATAAQTPDGRPKAPARPPRPQCTIMPGWRLGHTPQSGHRAGSSWGTPSLAVGHPLPGPPWDTGPHQGPTPCWQRGEQGGCGVPGQ